MNIRHAIGGITLPPEPYVVDIGAFVFAFAYLEGSVVDLIERLDPGKAIGPEMFDAGPTASRYKSMLSGAIDAASDRIGAATEAELRQLVEGFDVLIRARNDVLHARPMTAPDGTQRLYRWGMGRAIEITAEGLRAAAVQFAEAAVANNRVCSRLL